MTSDQAVAHAVANARLEGVVFDAGWVETLHSIARGEVTAQEVIDSEIAEARADR
jgi:hypothetical protein